MNYQLLWISLLTVISSTIGTITGFGTSTIMLPVLLLFLPVPETLLLVGLIHASGELWRLWFYRAGVRWKLVLGFGVPGIVFSFIGARLSFELPPDLLLQLLGGFLLGYAVFLVVNPSLKLHPNNVTAGFGGALSGFFAGVFGVGGAVRAAFLSIFDLPKGVYLATMALVALVIDSTRVATYMYEGTRLPPPFMWGLFLFVALSFFGTWAGAQLVEKIPQKSFRIVIAVFLIIIAIKFLFFPSVGMA